MTDKSTGIRVLFTGQYWPGSNTVYLAHAFEKCGAIVHFMNDCTLFPGWETFRGKAARRLLWKTVIEPEWNQQLLSLYEHFKPDLVYITDAHYCWPDTLQAMKQQSTPLMCFYHDPPWKNRSGSNFSINITHFDLIATTRAWHKTEFEQAGAKAVAVVRFGYEPLVHRPISTDMNSQDYYRSDVCFIGSYRAFREAELGKLVGQDFPYDLKIWGGGWNQLQSNSPLLPFYQNRGVYENEIPIVYATSKIALHWVNWEPQSLDLAIQKGDEHNSRTFQIAACGGAMMLAQRTDEHLQFFSEDAEAVYFDDVDELRDKLNYWLKPAQDEARHRIAQNARARCLKEDYSYKPVVKSFLQHFNLPVAD
jgi:glycosyltransferase involved in cell wall biosynthesis